VREQSDIEWYHSRLKTGKFLRSPIKILGMVFWTGGRWKHVMLMHFYEFCKKNMEKGK